MVAPSKRIRGVKKTSGGAEHPVIVIAKAIRDANRLETKAMRLALRLKVYGLPNPSVCVNAAQIAQMAGALKDQLRAVPHGWKAQRGSVGNAPIEPGDHVTLKREALKRFGGLVVKDRLFEVMQIAGNRLVCHAVSGDGLTILVTRSNVVRFVEPI